MEDVADFSRDKRARPEGFESDVECVHRSVTLAVPCPRRSFTVIGSTINTRSGPGSGEQISEEYLDKPASRTYLLVDRIDDPGGSNLCP